MDRIAHTFPCEWAGLGNREMHLLEFNRTDIARYAGMRASWYVLITKKLVYVNRDIQVSKLFMYKF
jgi:hypothetical protein